jgi:hypothetical protein
MTAAAVTSLAVILYMLLLGASVVCHVSAAAFRSSCFADCRNRKRATGPYCLIGLSADNSFKRQFWGVHSSYSPGVRSTPAGVHADLSLPLTCTVPPIDNTALVVDRRSCFNLMMGAATCTLACTANSAPAAAAPSSTVIYSREQVTELLQNAIDTLQTLLNNWSKAVVDCTYADVSRDLLETKNKELLLKKASTSALFDKSGSVVISCKTSNRVVRDYLGLTGKGPLVGLSKLVKNGMNQLITDDNDDDDLELYIQSMEELERTMARASSYSYSAGTIADVNAIQNFDPTEQDRVLESNDNANLRQTKQAIQESLMELQKLVAILKRKRSLTITMNCALTP